MALLKVGSTGDEVKKLQQQLGITADGIFGPQTQAAVKAYQQKSGLAVDGIVGSQTSGSLTRTAQTTTPAATPVQTAQEKKVASEEYQWGPLDPAYKNAIMTGTETDYYKNLNEKIANYQPAQEQPTTTPRLSTSSTGNVSTAPAPVSAPAQTAYTAPEAPDSYSSNYGDDIQALVDKILGYGEYKPYDPSTDPVYKSYEDKYNREGDRAFQSTIGDLAAVSGDGRLDSWASSAAAQARNNYSQKLMDVIPELEGQNYNRYLQGLDTLGSQLGAVQDVEGVDYNRYRDLIGDYQTDRNFGRNVFESDRGFDRGVLESDRSFDQGVLESDRNYDRGVVESDRNYDRDALESDRNFDYNATRDQILDDRWMQGFNADEQQRIVQNALDQKQISISEANAALSSAKFDYEKTQDALKQPESAFSDDDYYKRALSMLDDTVDVLDKYGNKTGSNPKYTNEQVIEYIMGLSIDAPRKAEILNALGI